MPEEMKQEAIEFVVTACEKHAANNEVQIKNNKSKQYQIQIL